jgi:hypothetical protein
VSRVRLPLWSLKFAAQCVCYLTGLTGAQAQVKRRVERVHYLDLLRRNGQVCLIREKEIQEDVTTQPANPDRQ